MANARRSLRCPADARGSGLIAFCMVFGEDVANTWSAVYLRRAVGAGPALAAGAFPPDGALLERYDENSRSHELFWRERSSTRANASFPTLPARALSLKAP